MAGGTRDAAVVAHGSLAGHAGAGRALERLGRSLRTIVTRWTRATAAGRDEDRRIPIVPFGAKTVAAVQIADERADVWHPVAERAGPD